VTKPQKSLLAAGAVVTVLCAVPAGAFVLLPLLFLNTHVHELGHALAAVVSGGSVGAVYVLADASGRTPVTGGLLPLVASAGYVGSAVVGGLLLSFSRTPRGSRAGLAALAALMVAGVAVFVRGDLVGIATGWAWAGILCALAVRARGRGAVFTAQFFGLLLCLTSWQAFLALFHIGPSGHSDATVMERATGVPAVVWAGSWLVVSGVVVAASLRRAWSGAS
jgi:hypothetical protein